MKNNKQPDPTPNNHPYVWDLVIQDMKERNEMGEKIYKTKLQPFNGRDALQDAYEEALDLCVYLRQVIYENEKNIEKEDTSLMDIEYLAHIDMWMFLGFYPELEKNDYLKCKHYPKPSEINECHACDIAGQPYRTIIDPLCVGECPLNFEIICVDDNSLWKKYIYAKDKKIKSEAAFEIMMTPWKRK